MTHTRETIGTDACAPARFADATWAAMQATGPKRLAAALGTSVSWLHKTSNPTTGDCLSLDRALAADLACAAAGHGTPLFDAYERALVAAGARARAGGAARAGARGAHRGAHARRRVGVVAAGRGPGEGLAT